MHTFEQLSLEDLFDLLVEQTELHTQLIATGSTGEQFNLSRDFLLGIQREIMIRKNPHLSRAAAAKLAG